MGNIIDAIERLCCGKDSGNDTGITIISDIPKNPEKELERKLFIYENQIKDCKEEEFPSGVRYKGQYNKQRMRHGIGKLSFPNRSYYIGQFENNVCCGNGIFILNEEESMEGNWKNDQLNGFASITAKDYVYTGECLNNLPHGKGEKIYVDGLKYNGEFSCGKRQGKGELVTAEWVYDGYFNDDLREGFGKCRWLEDNSTYTGYWVKDKFEGKGCFIWPDGKIYEGEYEDGQKNGIGVLRDKEGNILYDGYWIRGQIFQGSV